MYTYYAIDMQLPVPGHFLGLGMRLIRRSSATEGGESYPHYRKPPNLTQDRSQTNGQVHLVETSENGNENEHENENERENENGKGRQTNKMQNQS